MTARCREQGWARGQGSGARGQGPGARGRPLRQTPWGAQLCPGEACWKLKVMSSGFTRVAAFR